MPASPQRWFRQLRAFAGDGDVGEGGPEGEGTFHYHCFSSLRSPQDDHPPLLRPSLQLQFALYAPPSATGEIPISPLR